MVWRKCDVSENNLVPEIELKFYQIVKELLELLLMSSETYFLPVSCHDLYI